MCFSWRMAIWINWSIRWVWVSRLFYCCGFRNCSVNRLENEKKDIQVQTVVCQCRTLVWVVPQTLAATESCWVRVGVMCAVKPLAPTDVWDKWLMETPEHDCWSFYTKFWRKTLVEDIEPRETILFFTRPPKGMESTGSPTGLRRAGVPVDAAATAF